MAEREGVRKTALGKWLFGSQASAWMCRASLVPLRLMTGVIFAAHGAQKAFGWFGGIGFGGTVEMFRNTLHFPVPGLFAVLLIVAELVGGLMLIVGLAPRLAAAAVGVVMIGALFTVHRGQSFFETHTQQMVLAACVTIMFGGAGEFGMQRSRPPS